MLFKHNLSADNCDNDAALLDKRHNHNVAVGALICDEQRLVAYDEKHCEQRYP